EEEKIERCLQHLTWADERVIVDSNSTDKTAEIAKKYTKKIYKRQFDGYGQQKQAAINKCTHDWILEVDADEVITKELQEEIQQLQKNPEKMNKHAAYNITRQEYFLKKPLMRSKIPRLYKKQSVQYKGEIHEYLEIKGSRGYLKGKIEHESDNYDTIAKRVDKINEYTKREVEIKIKQGSWSIWKVLVKMAIMPLGYFCWLYVRKGLMWKGYRGLIWSLLTAYYHFLIYAKIYEYIYKTRNTTESESAEE
ncbi:MAG: glycosyltransferase family 2 protein, partial [Nanoarchaeota archaeon]